MLNRAWLARLLGGPALALIMAVAAVAAPTVENVKLSPEISGTAGRFGKVALAAGRSTVLLLADLDTLRRSELYSIPLAGGAPRKINGPLAAGNSVDDFIVLPGGSDVLFLAEGQAEVANIGSGARLTLPTAPYSIANYYPDGNSARAIWVSPTGQHILMVLTQSGDPGLLRLFRVEDGAALADVAGRRAPVISPDGKCVVTAPLGIGQRIPSIQKIDVEASTVSTLYEAPAGYSVTQVSITSDSQWVVFHEAEVDGWNWAMARIKRVPMAGGPPQLLVTDAWNFILSPGSAHIIFRRAPDSGLFPMFSVLPGGSPMQLADDVMYYQVTPDGSQVIYESIGNKDAENTSDRISRIFSVPADGGAPVKLAEASYVPMSGYWNISPAGKYVYGSNLYVPLEGGPAVTLGDLYISRGEFSQDDQWIFVKAPTGTLNQQVRAVRTSDAHVVTVDGDLPYEYHNAGGLAAAASGNPLAVYSAGSLLRIGDVAGTRTTLLDQGAFHHRAGGVAAGFSIDAAAGRVFFDVINATLNTGTRYSNSVNGGDLRLAEQPAASAGLAGGPYPEPTPPPEATSGSVASSDGKWVYQYQRESLTLPAYRYAGTIRNPESGAQIDAFVGHPGGQSTWPTIRGFSFSPDSRTAVVVTQGVLSDTSTHMTVIDLNARTAKSISGFASGAYSLGGSPGYGGLNPGYKFTPDSRKLIVHAASGAQGPGLYAATIADGSWRKVAGLQTTGGTIRDFTIAPDGSSVTYCIQTPADSLYVVSLEAGEPSLLTSPAAGSALPQYGYHPKYQCVVYRQGIYSGAYDFTELWASPLGGGAPIKLNVPMVSHGRVIEFRFDPVSGNVIYRGDLEEVGVTELYAAKFGGAEPYSLYSAPRSTVRPGSWNSYR